MSKRSGDKRGADIPVRVQGREAAPQHSGLKHPHSSAEAGQGIESDASGGRGMSDSNMLAEPLPQGWRNLQFGDICDRVKDSYQPANDGDTPYIGLEHLAQGFPAFVGRGTESEVKSSKTAFKVGDILFGKLRPYLRKGAQADFDGVCSTDILVFRTSPLCESEFLKFVIHSDEFIAYAKSTTSGVQHPRTSWPSLREFRLSLPPLSEQRKIAHILSAVQRAIEAQERIIATTTELKKALMHKLFKEGLRGERQKETEIGFVPESWEVVRLGCSSPRLLTVMRNGYTGKQTSEAQKFSVSRIETIGAGYIDRNRVRYATAPSQNVIDKYLVRRGDILFSHINSDPHLGKTGIVDSETSDLLHGMNLLLIRANQIVLNPWFLNLLFQWYREKGVFISICSRAVNQSSINQGKMNALEIPLPKIMEQEEIAATLGAIEEKYANHERKRSILQDLFRTILHELMTAKRRVHEMEITI